MIGGCITDTPRPGNPGGVYNLVGKPLLFGPRRQMFQKKIHPF